MINSMAIVGGGSAGLVAALIIKTKFPHINLDIIRSKSIGTIGVGEGSTEHWSSFMEYVGLDSSEVIRECDSTFKSGIMFKGWSDNDYLQSIGNRLNSSYNHYPYIYADLISKNVHPRDLVSDHAWESKVNTWFIGQESKSSTVQFHFNTHKLNDYLTKKCIQRGINVYDDEIINVVINESGNIESVISEETTYNYDFYIDSTGFKKLLISKLGATWRSHKEFLKMKSAIVFPTEHKSDNINMWTTAQALEYGWMFTIPVWDRCGNGYIFDSDYISSDQAVDEVEKFLGHAVDVTKQINFDPGALDKSWIKNCCAIGLSSSFIEPLEASSIGTSIQQTFLLCEKFINYNEFSIKSYNDTLNLIIDNIRDFIVLHYITKKQSSTFWRDVSNIKLPDSLSEKLEVWRYKMPVAEDFQGSSFYLFTEFHHILVMYGLGLFNTPAIRYEYDVSIPDYKKEEARFIINEQRSMRCQTIPHKTMIELIRTLKNENY